MGYATIRDLDQAVRWRARTGYPALAVTTSKRTSAGPQLPKRLPIFAEVGGGEREFGPFITASIEKYGAIAKRAGIKPE